MCSRGSLSDDYKRRVYEGAQRNRERSIEPGEEGYSPECYMISLVFSAALIGLLVMFIIYVSKLPQAEKLYKPEKGRIIVKNKAFTVVTESLDCSLYMKRRSILGDNVVAVIHQGIVCLSMLIPYCASGMYSSLSMMYIKRIYEDGERRYWYSRQPINSEFVVVHYWDGTWEKMGDMFGYFNKDILDYFEEGWDRSKEYGGQSESPRKFRVPKRLEKHLLMQPNETRVRWLKTFGLDLELEILWTIGMFQQGKQVQSEEKLRGATSRN
ncbi:hypothetical protein Y032_0083g1637 [Ancylostoma ceylanicum]|uniref:Uncharacterized protein n=1 Tax=Ancylostoma ceylanicum TaxID=53326 RepID=A0A016TQ92_9BILA|nr:hypothetical protein Y032_0083g1637 [Ancylostoma ceylanicum]